MPKLAKNLTVGAVVEVPAFCFDERRSGWNGWLFSAGIIRKVAKFKNGEPAYLVEAPTGVCFSKSPCVEKTKKRWFRKNALFEYNLNRAKEITKCPFEDYCGGRGWSASIQFLIDNGVIPDYKAEQ